VQRKSPLLTEAQWTKIEPLLRDPLGPRPTGRPRSDTRRVLEGILWVLKHQARWRDLPSGYPSPSTCWRTFHRWQAGAVWLRLWRAFLEELDEPQRAEWGQRFIDAIMPNAKETRPKPAAARNIRRGWWLPTAKVFLSEVATPGARRLPARKGKPGPLTPAAKRPSRKRSKRA